MLYKNIGSSPNEIDYKRQLTSMQWARFCGRHSCAELIEKWSRTRNSDKEMISLSKDQDNHDSATVTGRARANSAVQTISKVNIEPIKSDKGNFQFSFFTKLSSSDFFCQTVVFQNLLFTFVSFSSKMFPFRYSIKNIKSI